MTLPRNLLVDLAEDIGGQDGKLVGAVGVVQVGEDVLERLVVEHQTRGERVGGIGLVLLVAEVEQAGVVALVGLAEELAQAGDRSHRR